MGRRARFGGLWRHPDFLKLWAGQTISLFGTLMGRLAMSFTAIIVLGATPLQVALLNAAGLAPGLALGLFAGVWVDRLRRRPLLVAADLGRALLLASIPAAWVLGRLRIERDRDAVGPSLDPHDRRVRAGPDDRVGADHLVVRAVEDRA